MQYRILIVDSSVLVDAFDTNASGHYVAFQFVELARKREFEIVMPMHGLFEVKCAMRRIVHIEGKSVKPPYTYLNQLRIRTQPIDDRFVENYSEVEVPYAKAGDTIFLVMAKKLGLPLVTRDGPMKTKAEEAGIHVLSVQEAVNALSV